MSVYESNLSSTSPPLLMKAAVNSCGLGTAAPTESTCTSILFGIYTSRWTVLLIEMILSVTDTAKTKCPGHRLLKDTATAEESVDDTAMSSLNTEVANPIKVISEGNTSKPPAQLTP
jgi:hypothetical protein